MSKEMAPTLQIVMGRGSSPPSAAKIFLDQLNSKTSACAQRMRSSIVRG